MADRTVGARLEVDPNTGKLREIAMVRHDDGTMSETVTSERDLTPLEKAELCPWRVEAQTEGDNAEA
jgi:hypothetical protein